MKDSLEIPNQTNPTLNEISHLKQNLNNSTNDNNQPKPKHNSNSNPMQKQTKLQQKQPKISTSLTTDDIVNFRNTNPININNSSANPKFRISTPDMTNLRSHNSLNKSLTEDTSALRNKFTILLGKLNDNSTKEIAFSQLKEIITTNPTQSSLRIYLSSLSSFNQNLSINAKEINALLYGYIASVYCENLMDPLDSPSNIIKTINRIITHIKNLYLKENSYVIHKACSHSIMEIYDHCMPKDNLNNVLMLFIEPMASMLFSGNGKFLQEGAAIILSDFIYHLGQGRDDSELDRKILIAIIDRIIPLVIKKSLDNPYLYEALFNLMQLVPFENFVNYLKELYEQLGFVMKQSKYNYMTKVNAIKVIGLIAVKLRGMTDIAIGYYQIDIVNAIEYACKDRVHKVQLGAQEALREWKELEIVYKEMEMRKMEIAQPEIEGETETIADIQPGVKKMDKLNFLRNLAKMAKNENKKVEYDSELPEKMRDEVYKKGIGNILKLSNFLKNKNQKEKENRLITSGGSRSNNHSKSPNKGLGKINDNNIPLAQIKKYDSKLVMPNYNINNECDRITEVNEAKTEYDMNASNDNHKGKSYLKSQQQQQFCFNEAKEDTGDQMIAPLNDIKSKKRLPKLEETKEPKTYTNINTPIPQVQSQVIDLTNIKKQLTKMILTTMTNTFTTFEKQITSKLYDIETKINDISLKINDYQKQSPPTLNPHKDNDVYHINNQLFNKKSPKNEPTPDHTVHSISLNKDGIYDDIKAELNKSKPIHHSTADEDSEITKTWKETLKQIELGNIESAYINILNAGDDIYLLRLICITGPAFNRLSPEVSKRILMRVNMISRSHQIQKLLVNLIKESLNDNVFSMLNQNEQNDILDSLFEFSGINNVVGSEAAELYTRITK